MSALRLVLGAWCLASPAMAQSDSARARTVDEWLAQSIRRPAWVRTGGGHQIATVVSFVGGTAPFVGAAGLWLGGTLADRRNDQVAGRTATQSLLAASLVTGALKFTLGRARPYVTADTNSRDFKLNRGWGNDAYRSMPSGHSTAAFAFATALSKERARVRGKSASFDAMAYGSATLVALSRMMLDKHWASDILAGSAIGIASGLITFRLAH
jgi:membrane-associated phospholipid phosphatase